MNMLREGSQTLRPTYKVIDKHLVVHEVQVFYVQIFLPQTSLNELKQQK